MEAGVARQQPGRTALVQPQWHMSGFAARWQCACRPRSLRDGRVGEWARVENRAVFRDVWRHVLRRNLSWEKRLGTG